MLEQNGVQPSINFSSLAFIRMRDEVAEVSLGRNSSYRLADGSLVIDGPDDWGEIFIPEGAQLEYMLIANDPSSLHSTYEVSTTGRMGKTTLGVYEDGSGSRSGNIEVTVHDGLSERAMAETMGHELYTHVYLFFKFGINHYGHDKGRNESGQVVERNDLIRVRNTLIKLEINRAFLDKEQQIRDE